MCIRDRYQRRVRGRRWSHGCIPTGKMNMDEEAILPQPAQPAELKWQHVKWFIPNIIDYVRVLLMIAAPCLFTTFPLHCAFLYFLNHFLDDFDGWAARRWCQRSKFGEMIDMVIDVTSCVVFEAGVVTLYDVRLMPLFMISTFIDIAMLALVLTTRDDYWKILVAQPSSPWILRLCFQDGCHTNFGELLWKNQWCFHLYLYLAHFYPESLWSSSVGCLMLAGFALVKYQYVLRIKFFLQNWSEPNKNTKGDQPPTPYKQGAAAE
eukprot:TRINITY_DN522_c0_g1_i2.p1 TRINITY_DN522_c0_g1~~TRINITY_DN522_c0_g1_i2.p1  ORF type:complete len:264 (+),score=46.20 TRINITY_DN522_c0_g1_i2:147-938(+)